MTLSESMSFDQLLRMSEPKRIVRSRTVTGPPLSIDAYADVTYWAFNFKADPSTTGFRHHGYVKFLKPPSQRPLELVNCEVDCTCFSGDTLVLMGDGSQKKISEIRPGDSVYTHKGRIRPVSGNVERALRPGENVYSVAVTGFPKPLTVTGNHPFYAYRGNETCRCGCGQPLDEAPFQRREGVGPERTKRRFRRGHHPSPDRTPNAVIEGVISDRSSGISQRVTAKKYGLSESTVSNIFNGLVRPAVQLPDEPAFKWVKTDDFRRREWLMTPWLEEGAGGGLDPDLARFLGYYAAEGCFSGRGKLGGQVSFSLHRSEEPTLGADLTDIIGRLFARGTGFRMPDSRYSNRQELVRTNYCDLPTHKRKMQGFALTCCTTPEFRRFVGEHVGNGSWHKRLSPWLMAKDNETLRQVITGMFLGDGHLNKFGHFRWSSVSNALVWNVSTILNRLKVRHVVTNWGVSRGLDHLTIDINNPEAAKKVFGWLEPYMRQVQLERRPAMTDNLNHATDEGYLRAVKSRKKIEYSGTVWDLCVEEDHSFIAHGVAVANCPDYRFRWAWTNKQRGAGRVGPGSMNQAFNRAPKITNPTGQPGLCKHILAMRDFIYGSLSSFPATARSGDTSKLLNKLVRYADKRWTTSPADATSSRERERVVAATRQARNRGSQLPTNAPAASEISDDPVDGLEDELPAPPVSSLQPNPAAPVGRPSSAGPAARAWMGPNAPVEKVKPAPVVIDRRRKPSHESTEIDRNMNLLEAKKTVETMVEELASDLSVNSGSFSVAGLDGGADSVSAEDPQGQALTILGEIRDLLAQFVKPDAPEKPAKLPAELEPEAEDDAGMDLEPDEDEGVDDEDEEEKPGKK